MINNKLKLRAIFRNYALNNVSENRLTEILKNYYWLEGQEPENWKNFDGEIEILKHQDMSGDTAIVYTNNQKNFENIYNFLFKIRDIRFIEIEYNDTTKDFISKKINNFNAYSQFEEGRFYHE